jgi:hypothetical protein
MSAMGYLATITSQAEHDFLLSVMASLGNPQCWLGGYQDPTNSPPAENWHWVSGELWDYTNWGPNEPNDYWGPGSESYLQWRPPALIDALGTETKSILVEYEPEAAVIPSTWGKVKAQNR